MLAAIDAGYGDGCSSPESVGRDIESASDDVPASFVNRPAAALIDIPELAAFPK